MPKRRALADQTLMMATDNFYFLLQIYVFALQLVAQAAHFIESFPRCLFGLGARDGAANYLHKEPYTTHDRIGPIPLPMHRPETHGSDHLPADLKRKRSVGAKSEPKTNLPLA